MRLWALAFCAACQAAQVLFAQGKTHRFVDHLEAKREAALLKKQVPELAAAGRGRSGAARGL